MRSISRLASLLIILTSSAASCSHGRGDGRSTDSERGIVMLETDNRSYRISVDVVRTPEARARGLMFRKEPLPALGGMLFVFEREEVQSFWMKNTYIPLDMIFIDESRRVVGVVENAEPLTTASRSVPRPSRFVLELNAGFARRHGVREGTPVRFEEIPALP